MSRLCHFHHTEDFADKDQAVSALMDQRTRPATSAVNLATSPAIAKTLLLRVLDVVAVVSNPVVDPKSATRYDCLSM